MNKFKEKKVIKEKYWYVLFVKAGYENRVCSQLKTYFSKEPIVPFLPRIELFHRYANNQIQKEAKLMFPGYVFIESPLEKAAFVGLVHSFINHYEAPLRLLRYGNSCEFAMRENEKSLLQGFCNQDYCIEVSTGIIKGNQTKVLQGPLKGREHIIKKIDRSRRKAVIEVDFMERCIPITVGLDILTKTL